MTLPLSGCMSAYEKSVGGDTERVFSKIYLSDFNTTWKAVKGSLTSVRLAIDNRESGYIRTKWEDNTSKQNFIDPFGPGQSYLKAQYRLTLTIRKGLYAGKEATKVSVLKEQLVQEDILEGWRPVTSDEIDENTLHYRIGRLIYMALKFAKLEDEAAKEAIDEPVSTDEERDLDDFESSDDVE